MAAKRRVAVIEKPVVRRGPLRRFVLTLGIIFVVLALLENILGSVQVGGATLFLSSTWVNALHWLTGIAMLGIYFAGERASAMGARVVGIFYALLAVAGIVFRTYTGGLGGFDGSLPWAYTIIHGATALACLIAGYMRYGTYAAQTRRYTA